MIDPRTLIFVTAEQLADALRAIAPTLGQTTTDRYTTRGSVSVFCKPGGKPRWSQRANTARGGHVELAFQTRIVALCAAAQAFQEALYAWPAFRHPCFTFKIRNFCESDKEPIVYLSVGDKGIVYMKLNTLAETFDRIAGFTAGVSTQPSDPVWMVGGTAIGAPSAGAALVVHQAIAKPQTGLIPGRKGAMPRVGLLQDPKAVLADAATFVR